MRFETYSAGASPKPEPHPLALEILREDFRIDASDAYSKSWEEFKDAQFDSSSPSVTMPRKHAPSARPADYGTLEFSRSDHNEGSKAEKRRAFWQVAQQIKRRLELLAFAV